MKLDKLIELNCSYLESLSEFKITLLERIEKGIKTEPTKSNNELIKILLMEVMGQYLENSIEGDLEIKETRNKFFKDMALISSQIVKLYLMKGKS